MTVSSRVFICTCLIYIASYSALAADIKGILSHNGERYRYAINVPPKSANARNLLLVLHGYGDKIGQMRKTAMLDDFGDLQKSLVLYPQALKDDAGQTHWNVGTQGSEHDDVGFLVKLLQQAQLRHGISTRDTYILGYSNGGYMAYRMNCRFGHAFAGIVVIAGTMSGADWQTCDPQNPRPVLHIHGTEDEVVPYDGSPRSDTGWGGAPRVETVLQRWADWNGANYSTQVRAYDNADVTSYYDSRARLVSAFARLRDAGHDFPIGYDAEYFATAEAWAFFNTLKRQ